MKTVYDFNVKMTDGTEKSLKDYSGKVLLIVNTASKCGLTPQFKGLQELYDKFADRDFVILGFPCDQFNNQEFAQIDETLQFCQKIMASPSQCSQKSMSMAKMLTLFSHF